MGDGFDPTNLSLEAAHVRSIRTFDVQFRCTVGSRGTRRAPKPLGLRATGSGFPVIFHKRNISQKGFPDHVLK